MRGREMGKWGKGGVARPRKGKPGERLKDFALCKTVTIRAVLEKAQFSLALF